VLTDQSNRLGFAEQIVSEDIKLSGPTSIIGRSAVVKQFRDDFGRGGYAASSVNGNSGEAIAFGVIGKA
jgi:Cu-Zn family superoxide dismutase